MKESLFYINGHRIKLIFEEDAVFLYSYISEACVVESFGGKYPPDGILYVSTNENSPAPEGLDIYKRVVPGGRILVARNEGGGIVTGRYVMKINLLPSSGKEILMPFLLGAIKRFSYECFASTDTLLLHAASIEKDGNVYLFLGPSGSGKTTLCELSRDCRVIHDETSVVRGNAGGYLVYSGHGRERSLVPTNKTPLRAIFFIQKSRFNNLKKMPFKDAFMSGAVQCRNYALENRKRYTRVHHNLMNLFKAVPSFELKFKKDNTFWKEIIHVSQ